MAAPHLTAVPDPAKDQADASGEIVDLNREVETPTQRIRRLQLEAQRLAQEQIQTFVRELSAMAQRASEIAAGGEAYPVGARELAARISEDLPQKAQLLTALLKRSV
ncbi:MAG: hypothetical protein JO127_18120 [Caulobacteraceae bacterium]|nr:hypothetical protein [Caulobacteraceae bacterium]